MSFPHDVIDGQLSRRPQRRDEFRARRKRAAIGHVESGEVKLRGMAGIRDRRPMCRSSDIGGDELQISTRLGPLGQHPHIGVAAAGNEHLTRNEIRTNRRGRGLIPELLPGCHIRGQIEPAQSTFDQHNRLAGQYSGGATELHVAALDPPVSVVMPCGTRAARQNLASRRQTRARRRPLLPRQRKHAAQPIAQTQAQLRLIRSPLSLHMQRHGSRRSLHERLRKMTHNPNQARVGPDTPVGRTRVIARQVSKLSTPLGIARRRQRLVDNGARGGGARQVPRIHHPVTLNRQHQSSALAALTHIQRNRTAKPRTHERGTP